MKKLLLIALGLVSYVSGVLTVLYLSDMLYGIPAGVFMVAAGVLIFEYLYHKRGK